VASGCVFCDIRDKKIPAQIIAEDADLFVIKDSSPKAPVHYLIIPKEHVADIQSLTLDQEKIVGKMVMMSQQLANKYLDGSSFRLLVNSGAGAGQKVFHLHFHFLAGKQMSDF
jgi:histidine triad (HIT) family protein